MKMVLVNEISCAVRREGGEGGKYMRRQLYPSWGWQHGGLHSFGVCLSEERNSPPAPRCHPGRYYFLCGTERGGREKCGRRKNHQRRKNER
jgi:hypothetical protein